MKIDFDLPREMRRQHKDLRALHDALNVRLANGELMNASVTALALAHLLAAVAVEQSSEAHQ